MSKLTLFLASRFFHGGEHSSEQTGERKASMPAIRIATAGIAVGLAVMIVSVCVVKGFQGEVKSKLSGFTSHIEILDSRAFFSPESYPVVTGDSLAKIVARTPGLEKQQRVSLKMGILKTHDHFAGIQLKGLGEEYDTLFLNRMMVEGRLPQIEGERSSNEIAISRMLADRMDLKTGDRVYSYYFSNTVKQRRFLITGIYETHLKQFDDAVVLTDRNTVGALNGWAKDQSSGLEIKLRSFEDLPIALSYLQHHVAGKTDRMQREYSVVPINENPRTASVLSWLELLDFNVMVILVLMICVAGFSMVSGLLILILERTNAIGLLKALGSSNRSVRHTFLWYAFFIVGRGMLIGNLVGILLVGIQYWLKPVHLDPVTYYVDAVPVAFPVVWIVVLNLASLIVTLLSLILPSFLVSRIQPAKALQFD